MTDDRQTGDEQIGNRKTDSQIERETTGRQLDRDRQITGWLARR